METIKWYVLLIQVMLVTIMVRIDVKQDENCVLAVVDNLPAASTVITKVVLSSLLKGMKCAYIKTIFLCANESKDIWVFISGSTKIMVKQIIVNVVSARPKSMSGQIKVTSI